MSWNPRLSAACGALCFGPVGPAGPTGTNPDGAGIPGATGASGPTGVTGNIGPAGVDNEVTGAAGITGPSGPRGLTGATGARGPSGQVGFTNQTFAFGTFVTYDNTICLTGYSVGKGGPSAVNFVPLELPVGSSLSAFYNMSQVAGYRFAVPSGTYSVSFEAMCTVNDQGGGGAAATFSIAFGYDVPFPTPTFTPLATFWASANYQGAFLTAYYSAGGTAILALNDTSEYYLYITPNSGQTMTLAGSGSPPAPFTAGIVAATIAFTWIAP